MMPIIKGLGWAAAILVLAAANRFAIIPEALAAMLFALLPVAAVLALASDRACRTQRASSGT